jgi:hypothetical protein
MAIIRDALLHRWHGMLSLSRNSPSWYHDRYREELLELGDTKTPLLKLSETSDVFFSVSRAKYDGFPVGELPKFRVSHGVVYMYMLGKYTLRWGFYRVPARLCGLRGKILEGMREVVNPGKDSKLGEVAARHQIDPVVFERVGRRLRWVWPLMP